MPNLLHFPSRSPDDDEPSEDIDAVCEARHLVTLLRTADLYEVLEDVRRRIAACEADPPEK